MPSRNESARALARLQLETPISNDANLLNLQKQVEDFVREARHRDPSEPNELVSTVVDTVARDYFRHAKTTTARVPKGRRIMRFVLSLIVAVTVLGAIQASSEEIALGVSLASVDNRVTVGSSRNDCSDGDWNTAAIKEGESESPEMTAIIENNREDRERTVVIDR